eukprot:7028124-Alexandrium_andersonii.AAC.1
MASWRPGSMYPLSSATAPMASVQFQEGPWVVTVPSSCLLRLSETAGLVHCSLEEVLWGGGPPLSQGAVSYTHLRAHETSAHL